VLSLAILDQDLVAERMRPGGRRHGLRFVPIGLAPSLHRAVAGPDRGRLHVAPIAIALRVRRTKIEDAMLQRDLPG
jgi:hypothetical protein